MSVQVRHVGDVQVLQLSGDFTLSGSQLPRALDLQGEPLDDLGGTLIGLLDRGFRKIILDLSCVNFIDSSALGELVACKKRTVERGGDIKLLGPRERVQKLLVMTLLTQMFEVFFSEAEAVGSFAPDAAPELAAPAASPSSRRPTTSR